MFEDDLLGIIEGYTVKGEKRDEREECEARNYDSKELMIIARKGEGWKDKEAMKTILAHVEQQTTDQTKEANKRHLKVVDSEDEEVKEEEIAEKVITEPTEEELQKAQEEKETAEREMQLGMIVSGDDENNITPRDFDEVELKFIEDKGDNWLNPALKNVVLTQVAKQNADEIASS